MGEKVKKRKPVIVKVIAIILSILFTIALAFGILGIWIYKKYDVNAISVMKDLKVLNKKIDENTMYPNKFSESDMVDAKTIADLQLEGLIQKDENGNYIVNGNPTTNMTADIKFSDKQIGAILDSQMKDGNNSKIELGSYSLELSIVQLAFSNINDTNNSADVNIVIKLNMSELKADMKGFPQKMFKKKIPDYLYFSSTFRVTHGEEKFSYSLESLDLTINKLSKKQTKEVVNLINMVTNVGSVQDLNLMFAKPLMEGLIGNSGNEGFVLKLKDYGADDFTFLSEDNKNYFVVKCAI